MAKITPLAFHGIDKKSGLLKKCIDIAINEHKQVVKGLGGGLELVVTKNTGLATFYCRNPKRKIGLASKMSLANAFDAVDTLKKEQKKEKEEVKKRSYPTFEEFYMVWLDEKKEVCKKGSSRCSNFNSLFKRTLYPLHKVKLNEITPNLVFKSLSSIEQSDGNKHNAVSLLIQCLRNATLKGIIDNNPIADMLIGNESPFKEPKTRGWKWIPASEFKIKYFDPLRKTPLINRAFYLLIVLTCFRFNECRLLRWSWVNLDKKLIVIPADAVGANKTQRELVKPLTRQMLSFLKYWKTTTKDKNSEYVFCAKGKNAPVCEGTFREPQKVLTTGELDFHGIRKTMKTWLVSDDGGAVNEFFSELALTHDVRTSLQKIYDKNDYINGVRDALQKWNDYIESQLPNEYLELIKDN